MIAKKYSVQLLTLFLSVLFVVVQNNIAFSNVIIEKDVSGLELEESVEEETKSDSNGFTEKLGGNDDPIALNKAFQLANASTVLLTAAFSSVSKRASTISLTILYCRLKIDFC